jgi:hypothetical protein
VLSYDPIRDRCGNREILDSRPHSGFVPNPFRLRPGSKTSNVPPAEQRRTKQPAEGRGKRRPYTGFRKPISNLMIHVPSVGVHEILPVHDPRSVVDPVEALPGLQRSFTDIRVLDFEIHRT